MSLISSEHIWLRPDPLPDPVAVSERLVIRWYERDDAGAIFETINQGREALVTFLPWVRTSHRTPLQSRDFVDFATRARNLAAADDFVMGVFERDGGALVGGSGFHRIDALNATAEIGYWIAGDKRRRGYACESTAALLTVGFRDWGFRRIKLCCAAINEGSIAVIEKLGARLEAVERAERRLPGHGWIDALTYALLADEWDPETRRGPGGSSLPEPRTPS